MKAGKQLAVALTALVGLSSAAWAQPGVPGVPGGVPAGVATPAAPQTLWSFLGLGKAQKAECREKLCRSQLGMLLNNTMKPVNTFSGGIVPQLCPPNTPTKAELAAPGAVGAAAAIQADEAGAAQRKAAVRYLSRVDCHYWPEAEAALVGALREDRNECVRFEAALALGSGCCCTKLTIEKLRIAAIGSDEDGNPGESSERVRAASLQALQHCVTCFVERTPVKKERETKEGTEPATQAKTLPSPVTPTAFTVQVANKSGTEVVDNARRTLSRMTATPMQSRTIPTGSRSVSTLLKTAFVPPPAPPAVAPVAQVQPLTTPVTFLPTGAPPLAEQQVAETPAVVPVAEVPVSPPEAVPQNTAEPKTDLPATPPAPLPRLSPYNPTLPR